MRTRRRAALLTTVPTVLLAAASCGPPAGSRPAASALVDGPREPTTAFAVDSALGVVGRGALWPGFEPLRTPLAIYDGERTYLFRHPAPPAGYLAVSGRPGVVARDGRDPAVTANSSAKLGGVGTATVMLDRRVPAADVAALAVHELFHVFQRQRHAGWQANEAALFTYPVEDSVALALRREETAALAMALEPDDTARCWSRAFVDARARRFTRLGVEAAAYERGTELNEGLARYVERRAARRPDPLSAVDAPAGDVRPRAYVVGSAIATLLDRVRVDWREALDAAPATANASLDAMLAEAVGPSAGAGGCAAAPERRAAWAAAAGADVRALVAQRARARSEYLARGGWRVVVEAGSAPLFPAGFDPLNVARVSPTEILHTRFLKLQGPAGAVEIVGGSALTEGSAGAHPLFAGVRRVTVAGLSSPPSMRDSAGTIAIDAPGLSVRVQRARVDVAGDTVRVRPR